MNKIKAIVSCPETTDENLIVLYQATKVKLEESLQSITVDYPLFLKLHLTIVNGEVLISCTTYLDDKLLGRSSFLFDEMKDRITELTAKPI